MNALIRLASPSDALAIHQIYSPIVRNTHISFEESAPSVSEIAERVKQTLNRYPWLVCEMDRRLAGYAYASAFRSRAAYQWTAETTVYVQKGFQRRGISRALYRSLLTVLRDLGYVSVIGVIALPNAASVRAHETAGFRKVGVLKNAGFKANAWRDTGWWQLELRPPPAAATPPRSIAQLAAEPHFDDLLQLGLDQIRA